MDGAADLQRCVGGMRRGSWPREKQEGKNGGSNDQGAVLRGGSVFLEVFRIYGDKFGCHDDWGVT